MEEKKKKKIATTQQHSIRYCIGRTEVRGSVVCVAHNLGWDECMQI